MGNRGRGVGISDGLIYKTSLCHAAQRLSPREGGQRSSSGARAQGGDGRLEGYQAPYSRFACARATPNPLIIAGSLE